MIKALIGSLIMMGFVGTTPHDPGVQKTCKHLREGRLGGVILFGRNIVDSAQLKTLTTTLKAARSDVIIAVDQEGGRVQRLRETKGFTGTPAPATVAEQSVEQASRTYQIMAHQLSDHGITLNYTPVVDLNDPAKPCEVIGGLGRSYGMSTDEVVSYARACIAAHEKYGVHCCLKHFPGHGSAQGDTHSGCVDVTNYWRTEELEPFYALKDEASAIMTAHIMHRSYGEAPATLSPTLLKVLLRDTGYDGPIISDDLHMGALWWRYSINEVVMQALQAGVDLLVYSNMPAAALSGITTHADGDAKAFEPDHDMPLKIIVAVEAAITNGDLSVLQLEEAAVRVAKLRSSKG